MTVLLEDIATAHRTCRRVLTGGAWGELFTERRGHQTYELFDGEPSQVRTRTERGTSLRRVDGDGRVRLVSTAGISPIVYPALAEALNGGRAPGGHVDVTDDDAAWPPLPDGSTIAREADAAARHAGRGHDVQVHVKVITFVQDIAVADAERAVRDHRELVSVHVRAKARDGRRVRSGRRAAGATTLAAVTADGAHLTLAAEAVRAAVERLDAAASPSGLMPVVLGPGGPAMVLHEACGHPLEADLLHRRTSAFYGRSGERLAVGDLTLIDDPAFPRGSGGALYHVDDEGEPAQSVTLVDRGMLADSLTDRLHASSAGRSSNGHGRRLDYAHPPLPRMTSTYVASGSHDPDDIIRRTWKGLYVRSISGGDTDMGSGRFNLQVDEGYLIDRGRIGRPIRGAVLSGTGPELLAGIDMVGTDLAMECGTYVCNKLDQFPLLVSVGQPTLRIKEMYVWGS